MAKKKAAPQEAVAQEAAAVNATEQVTDATAATTQEAIEEKAKRERGYSQTAINKEDLERLNAFKASIKETRKINVSNQTILEAALNCLATDENMAAFLKKLVADAGVKQRAKDMKQLEALQAKLAQPETEA